MPFVVHDSTLSRTTDVQRQFPSRSPWRLQDFTADEIRTLDAGGWTAGGMFTGSRVLTLDEVLTELADAPVGLTVEAKNPDVYPRMADVLANVLAGHPAWREPRADGRPRLYVESFDWGFLDRLHAAHAEIPIVLLGPSANQLFDPAAVAARPWAAEVDVRHDLLGDDLVRSSHDLGLRVGSWTVNAAADMTRMVGLGVDGVTTDEVGLLRTLLADQGRTSTLTVWPERAPASTVTLRTRSETASLGTRLPLTVRLSATNGTPTPWHLVTVQTLVAGSWQDLVTSATDRTGSATVSLPVREGMRLRATANGASSATLAVPTTVPVVVAPVGSPAPAPLAAQPLATDAGAQPRTYDVSPAVWRQMRDRSWRRGCPVGRAGLRRLTVSYWGFDGHRHRGELVVAAGSAAQLARVFTRLYDAGQPVRGLRRLETLGGWTTAVARGLRTDSTFGFACQRTPGDPPRIGSHARGTVVSVNPWENPTRLGDSGSPNTWWLSQAEASPSVHTATHPVVQAFAAEGFAWNGSRRSAEFRDVR